MTYNNKILKHNITIAIIYLLGAGVSFAISVSNFYYLPIWLPFGLTLGYAFSKGRKVLAGFVVSSFLTHLFLGITVLKLQGMGLLISFLFFIVETLIFYFFTFFWEKYGWQNVIGRSSRDVNRFYLFVFLGSLPLAASFAIPFMNSQPDGYFPMLLYIYLSLITSALVYVPTVLANNLPSTEKFFTSLGQGITFFIIVFLIVLLGIDRFWYPFFGHTSDTFFYFVCFGVLFFLSVRFSYKVYSSTIALFVPLFLFSVWFNINHQSIVSIAEFYLEPMLFVFLVTIV